MESLDNNFAITEVVLAVFCTRSVNAGVDVFLQNRGTTDFYLWEFPGGKVDYDEKYEHALVREIQEELDLNIREKDLNFLGRFRYSYPDKEVALNVFIIEAHEPFIIQNRQCVWKNLKEINQNTFPIIAGSRSIVKELMNFYGLS